MEVKSTGGKQSLYLGPQRRRCVFLPNFFLPDKSREGGLSLVSLAFALISLIQMQTRLSRLPSVSSVACSLVPPTPSLPPSFGGGLLAANLAN